jgi:3-hydroxyacyl-[acyl-carrier-protein] dehydratase
MADDTTIQDPDTADILRIVEMIPHRYPMLMIDRVVDIVRDHSATGIKNVSINEPQFRGHFPNHPVMPGVMIVESMAQTAAVLVVHTLGPDAEGKIVYFMSIDGARFRQPVVPGDAMRVHVVKVRNRGPVWKFKAIAKVEGKVVAEAQFAAMIREDDGGTLA